MTACEVPDRILKLVLGNGMIHTKFLDEHALEDILFGESKDPKTIPETDDLRASFCVAEESEEAAYNEAILDAEDVQVSEDPNAVETCQQRHEACSPSRTTMIGTSALTILPIFAKILSIRPPTQLHTSLPLNPFPMTCIPHQLQHSSGRLPNSLSLSRTLLILFACSTRRATTSLQIQNNKEPKRRIEKKEQIEKTETTKKQERRKKTIPLLIVNLQAKTDKLTCPVV